MRKFPFLISALILGGFATLGTTLVAFTKQATAERIAENYRQALLQELDALIPRQSRDNDLLHDVLDLDRPLNLSPDRVRVYRARKQGEPIAALFSPVIARGYAGPIQLIVAVRYDGTLAGVRVLQHKETPGLGDKIDLERSDWILGFSGRSLDSPQPMEWRVKRDGGVFDQFTGATITPRGVINAVFATLNYFHTHRERLFAAAAAGELS